MKRWTVTHDFAYSLGGAERVTGALCKVMEGANFIYFAGDSDVVARMCGGTASSITRLSSRLWTETNYRQLSALAASRLARAVQVEGNILASSYAFAHWIPCSGRKIVYCHTPLRQAWSGRGSYLAHGSVPQRVALNVFGPRLRRIDRAAASTVDQFIATSRTVRDRIVRFYNPGSHVPIVAPPIVDELVPPTCRLSAVVDEQHFLWVGRITEPYKKLDLVIECFREESNRYLTVVGDGRDRAKLESSAPDNVRFVGWKSSVSYTHLTLPTT